jgi:hypothetical protein
VLYQVIKGSIISVLEPFAVGVDGILNIESQHEGISLELCSRRLFGIHSRSNILIPTTCLEFIEAIRIVSILVATIISLIRSAIRIRSPNVNNVTTLSRFEFDV